MASVRAARERRATYLEKIRQIATAEGLVDERERENTFSRRRRKLALLNGSALRSNGRDVRLIPPPVLLSHVVDDLLNCFERKFRKRGGGDEGGHGGEGL